MLTPETVVVVYVSNDVYTRRYDLDIVAELVCNLGTTNVVTVSASPEGLLDGPTVTLPGLARLDDALIALPALIVAQLTALNMSLALEHTPDNPFPSGEVNRVVQGVTVHPLPD